MRKEGLAAVVAILVVASLGIGYLSGSSARGTETITSTSTSVSTSTLTSQRTVTSTTTSTSTVVAPFVPGATAIAIDSNGSTGVGLVLALNATTLKVGQRLNVDVSLFNTLPTTNSVPAAKDWPFKGVPVALWYPCYFDTPAYAVVLKGNYSLQELQTLVNTTASIMCAEGARIDHVVFQPSSSQANLTGSGFGPIPGPYQLSLNFTTNGYWDLANQSQLNPPILGMQIPPRPPVPTPFVPGAYTLAVSDEWGQAAVLHFTVKG